MGAIASQITSLPIVHPTVYSGGDQRKHQSSPSLVFVRGIHRWPVNSPHKGPVTRKMFPFDDVIMVMVCMGAHTSFRITSMSLGQSNDCNQTISLTPVKNPKRISIKMTGIHWMLIKQNETKHNKTVCMFMERISRQWASCHLMIPKTKAPNCWPFVRDSQGPVMRKVCPCDGAFMLRVANEATNCHRQHQSLL